MMNPIEKYIPAAAAATVGLIFLALGEGGAFFDKLSTDAGIFMGGNLVAIGAALAFSAYVKEEWNDRVKIASALAFAILFVSSAIILHEGYLPTMGLLMGGGALLTYAFYQQMHGNELHKRVTSFYFFSATLLTSLVLPAFFQGTFGNGWEQGATLLTLSSVALAAALVTISLKYHSKVGDVLLGAVWTAFTMAGLAYLGHTYMNFDASTTTFLTIFSGGILLTGLSHEYERESLTES